MIDVEQRLRDELDLLAPAAPGPDWSGVLRLAGEERRRARRRFAVAAVVLVAALGGIFVATPLGGAVVHGLGGFSAWLTGRPGSPASKEEQRLFDEATGRSWLKFPPGTQLRRLANVTDPATGATVDLLGFRSTSALCLRVAVVGRVHGSALGCAPLDELRKAGAPVRVILVDAGFGTGTKTAPYGVDRLRSFALQVTAGIAADGVRRVVVVDGSGRHTVLAASNAFLYVASKPDVGQRVRRIWAETDTSRIAVPFAPGGGGAKRTKPWPTKVDRKVSGGTIGWLDRREPRGEPVAPGQRNVVFGRVITPDPARPLRVAVMLSHTRHGTRPTRLCYSISTPDSGAGGGCVVRASVFARGPLLSGPDSGSSWNEFMTVGGLASDDVARIVAFLSDGQTMPVPLADNVYGVEIARSRLPARLVAYDAKGRVIGFAETIRDHLGHGGGPVRGRARLLVRAVSPTGASATAFVGASTTGGRCWYVRWYREKRVRAVTQTCAGLAWRGAPLQLGGGAEFVYGRVRPDVVTVILRFGDGRHATVAPREGFVLYAVPRKQLAAGHKVVAAVARDAAGAMLGTERFSGR